jgi:oligoendopeptidase F
MNRSILMCFISVFLIMANTGKCEEPTERSAVKDIYKWNLNDIYSTYEDWVNAKEKLKTDVDKFESFKGKLGTSSEILLNFLNLASDFNKNYTRVYVYASMSSDQDIRETQKLAMVQELKQLSPVIGAKMSFSEPEILSIGKEKVDKFIAEQPGLGIYKMYLHDLYRKQEHLLSESEETLLAQASSVMGSSRSIYNVFSNAELPYPQVTLSTGETVLLNQAGYAKYRTLPSRADRELVFKTFWSQMGKFQRTFAEQLLGQMNVHVFNTRVRKYNSTLASALDESNIPESVYHSLVENVNRNLPTFYRYLALRKRMLGLDTLKYSDMYTPVVNGIDLKYSYEDAQKLIIDALKPLGADYQSVIKKAFIDRWIDVMPTSGKRSGAYSNGGAYDVHSYILLNYNEQYNDVSTTAHELGHTMQSYLSNKKQPYPLADYPIFVAEVASTFNEDLLSRYMVNKVTDDKAKLSLLMDRLDGFKGTLFRQTQFAEFELAIHQKVEAGEPLTSDVLNKIYGDILKKYYGHDKGVCYIDDLYSLEWSFIPHFYYNYYVYQYATSFTASAALAEKVYSGEKGSKEKYLDFLSAGGSEYPIDLLKKAGVDMTTSEPFDKAIAAMNRIMDEIEAILNKK